MRMSFDQLFQRNTDGMISPRVPVQINGVTMGKGVGFGRGVAFGGVDLNQFVGKELDVEVQNEVHVIKGID